MDYRTYSPEDEKLIWEMSMVGNHWHVTCLDNENAMRGSGFSLLKETSKKKAFSELNERYLVGQLKKSESFVQWGLDFDGSCSGFAVGHSKTKAVIRSVAEGLERWTLSRWIDDQVAIPELKFLDRNEVQSSIAPFFESISAYLQPVQVQLQDRLVQFYVAVVLGWSGQGVFAGYGTKVSSEEAIDHAHIESLRNLLIFRNQAERELFPYNRIKFFAENANLARQLIAKAKPGRWGLPRMKLLKAKEFGNLWLSRSIFEGWIPWQNGSNDRFLY